MMVMRVLLFIQKNNKKIFLTILLKYMEAKMLNDRYNELIDSMAREIDQNSEYPNKYSDEFVGCASESLKKEIDTMHIKGLLVFDAIIKGDRTNGKLLIEHIAKYMIEENDVLKKVI